MRQFKLRKKRRIRVLVAYITMVVLSRIIYILAWLLLRLSCVGNIRFLAKPNKQFTCSTEDTDRVLVIGPAWIGDMVMAQSLFKLLKKQGKVVDVVAPPYTVAVLKRMPEVSQVIPLDIGHGEIKFIKRYRLARQLNRIHYSQAIVLPNSFKSAFIPFFANIPKRSGWYGEYRNGFLNDVRPLDKKEYPLMVQRYAALAFEKNSQWDKQFPNPQLQVNSHAIKAILSRFKLSCLDSPILALSPGAAYGPAKRWPPEYFAEVANIMLARGWQVWLFGSKNETPIAAKIQAITQHACINFTGCLQLEESVDILSKSSAVVANDSGLMHIAAALNIPVVAIYGSTSSSFAPPLTQYAKILERKLPCRPCRKRQCPLKHMNCLRELQPVQAINAIQDLA